MTKFLIGTAVIFMIVASVVFTFSAYMHGEILTMIACIVVGIIFAVLAKPIFAGLKNL